MVDFGRNRPSRWCRPKVVARRILVGICERHLLAVAVGHAEFAIHSVGKTRVPNRIPGPGAGDQELIARAEGRQVEGDACIDAPAFLLLLKSIEAGDVDIVTDARHLSRPPTLNDLQVADEIWNALSVDEIVVPRERPLKLLPLTPFRSVPPPLAPLLPLLCAAIVAEKPPPNEAV